MGGFCDPLLAFNIRTKRHIVRARGFGKKTQQPLGFICCVEVIVRYNATVSRNSFK